MRWVYILQCEDDYFYVGETSRLYRRFWEHEKGKGGINTALHPPVSIVAIYKVNILGKFFTYAKKVSDDNYRLNHNIYFNRGEMLENFNDNDDENGEYESLWVENNVTEKMMLNDELNWEKVRGGKYVKSDVEYNFPKNQVVEELPNCNCGFPCDVKYDEINNFLFFRCAKKNIWPGLQEKMGELFEIYDSCKFFMKYTNDYQYKIKLQKKIENVETLTIKSPWLKELVGGMYEHCVGGCGKDYDEDNTIRYSRKAINLCFDCFIDKNEELAEKYTVIKCRC